MSPQEEKTTFDIWRKAFTELEQSGIPAGFGPRQLASLYAVASICYHGNGRNFIISDAVYDRLCGWLLRHLDECKDAGANLLDEELLRCHSGYRLELFVQPYHDVAAVLLGHPCWCVKCTTERNHR